MSARLKPKKITITYPAELEPLIQERLREEHYNTVPRYFLGLLLFDLSSRCKHWLTSQLMSEPQDVRDKVIDEIVREFPNMPRRDGGWFRARIREIISEHRGRPLSEGANIPSGEEHA